MPQAVSKKPLQVRTTTDVANCRVYLALLRMFREVPISDNADHHDTIGRAFWPLIRLQPRELRNALKVSVDRLASMSHRRQRRRNLELEIEDSDTRPLWLTELLKPSGTLPVDPPDPEVLLLLGEGLLGNTPAFRNLFNSIERDLEKQVVSEQLPIDRNVAWLSTLLELDLAEERLLSLCGGIEVGSVDRDLFAHFRRPTRRDQALRVALRLDSDRQAASAVARRGRLVRSGVLQEQHISDLGDMLQLSRLAATLVAGNFKSIEDMATRVLNPLAPSASSITLAWPHLQERSDLLENLLANALRSGERGVNLMLYGAPGTGKTEYARRLVERSGAIGFRIDDTDDDQCPASRHERLSYLRLSELFAPAGASILVLDEAEDVFQGDYNGLFHRALGGETDSKSWMNQVLEDNRVPVIWISNKIGHIDPAYLRRFSYCLEFPVMPRSVRRKIAHAHLAPVGCSEQLVDAVASQPRLAPALLASAARFVALAGVQGGTADGPGAADAAARHMLTDHLKAIGETPSMSVPSSVTRFDLRYLHVQGSAQPEQVLESLKRMGRGTVLLGGPAGTGKTQLAAEIARRLGRELVYRTASDINSMWYGESERNVARLFTECDPAGEVLFVDEADTLLGDRSAGGQRADRAVTAEFLRRVEAFQGVFVCATNHASEFDPALMRRFVFRLRFIPLNSVQREEMLLECLGGGRTEHDAAVQALKANQLGRLQRLDQLTPGDFANVARRVEALQLELGVDAWIDELEAEHQAKPQGARGSIGFF